MRRAWGELYLCVVWCERPTGGRHGLTTDDPAQRFKGAKRRAAPGTKETQRRPGQYKGWGPTPSFAAAKLGSLILREDCYNVVTQAPTVGNDLLVPDSKRERGVNARYALLLGTRSAGGGRRPGDRLGAVPIGPPLALAARRGPGLTHRRLPRPVNGERRA